VSRLCGEIDDKVKAFLARPIEGDWPYLWVDATYVKVRQNGRIVSVAVIVAVGVNSDGRRKVLGMDIGPSEAETFWTAFLRKLARRGLRGVKLVVSDAHEGIKAAVSKVLNATWQRYRVHFMRAREGRLTQLAIDIVDRPGQLAVVSNLLGEAGANIIEVSHQRTFSDLPAKATLLELVIETRDKAHLDEVLAQLGASGFKVRL
jgi:transposase-like protein